MEFFDDRIVKTDRLSWTYPRLLQFVMDRGQDVPSRIEMTKEILDLQLVLTDPRYCVVTREGMSERFMLEEIIQLLAGRHDNERLREITPLAADLITPATAYGPRTWRQLRFVADELTNNNTSRRGVVYIGRSDDLVNAEGFETAGEMPCTETWQFHLRENKLNMTVNMRSWDLVWGLSFDIPSFVAVQMMLARHLGAELGSYTHNAGSGHIYEKHFDVQAAAFDKILLIDEYLRDTVTLTQRATRVVLEASNMRRLEYDFAPKVR